MADPTRKVPENVPGDFFVDLSCIDCDTCRQLAPDTFGETDDYAYVQTQPADEMERRAALRALVCCPTGSIGSSDGRAAAAVKGDFPLLVEERVAATPPVAIYYNGFTSRLSFGGSSYFVRHPEGNWLVDSPRFQRHLVRRLEELGGVSHIFLTHRDDVADAARYAAHFGSRRVIHAADRDAQPNAEVVLEGSDPVELDTDFLAIPTPGHTEGHSALLVSRRYLFTGDHLWWSRNRQGLIASKHVCWHSWPRQLDSLHSLLDYDFEWVLPGHGEAVHLPAHLMQVQLHELLERLRA